MTAIKAVRLATLVKTASILATLSNKRGQPGSQYWDPGWQGDHRESDLDKGNRRYGWTQHPEMPSLQEGGGVSAKAARPIPQVQALRPQVQREGQMTSIEHILVAASVLLLLSVLASKASAKLGVPALLLFLVLGMLAGSDGPGGIYFDNARLAQSLGVVALALILFSGGLDTEWSSVRPVLCKGLALSTCGVLITAVLVGLFARIVLGF